MASRKKSNKTLSRIFWSVLLFFIIYGLVGAAVQSIMQEAYDDAMKPLDTSAAPAPGADKVVVYFQNMSDDEGHYVKSKCPEEYRAKEAQDVAAVVYVTRGNKIYGRYSNGQSGYVAYYLVKYFDLTSQKTLESVTLEGGNPPSSISSDRKGTITGSIPSDESIQETIAEMCAKYLP